MSIDVENVKCGTCGPAKLETCAFNLMMVYVLGIWNYNWAASERVVAGAIIHLWEFSLLHHAQVTSSSHNLISY